MLIPMRCISGAPNVSKAGATGGCSEILGYRLRSDFQNRPTYGLFSLSSVANCNERTTSLTGGVLKFGSVLGRAGMKRFGLTAEFRLGPNLPYKSLYSCSRPSVPVALPRSTGL